MAGHGHGPMRAGEKAKDFKGTMKKLWNYISEYRIGLFFVMVFAICSTVFSIAGMWRVQYSLLYKVIL